MAVICSAAANWAALGILYNTGQDCTAGSRVYVQESIYDKFVEILVGKAKQLVIGDGFDEKSGGGPVVSLAIFTLQTRNLSNIASLAVLGRRLVDRVC